MDKLFPSSHDHDELGEFRYQRFKLKTNEEKKIHELENIITKRCITREELIAILDCLELNHSAL